jgi:hypothetical protein
LKRYYDTYAINASGDDENNILVLKMGVWAPDLSNPNNLGLSNTFEIRLLLRQHKAEPKR